MKTKSKYKIEPTNFTFAGKTIPRGSDEMSDFAKEFGCSGRAEAEAMMDQYSMSDYFEDGTLNEVYDTKREAKAAAKAAYKGDDSEGIGLEWDIVEAGDAQATGGAR